MYEEDKVVWKQSKSEKYTVKSMHYMLTGAERGLMPLICNTCIPPRAALFGWEPMQGKTLTLDNVQRRGIPLPNRRHLCEKEEEMVEHFLLHWKKTKILWSLVFSLWTRHN